jgi:hypothetical protein
VALDHLELHRLPLGTVVCRALIRAAWYDNIEPNLVQEFMKACGRVGEPCLVAGGA